MDYALATALKHAGFFQEGRGTRVAPPDKIVARRDDYAYVPTLEELIEACQSFNHDWNFYLAGNRRGTWWAKWTEAGNLVAERSAVTPIEAVAHLWLALNRK